MKFVYLSPSVSQEMRLLRKEIALSMNGVLAESLEKQGLSYKRNYGVVVSRLCEIARRHAADSVLAEALWCSGEREFMLLACMLQPHNEFTFDSAKKWLKQVHNVELAEQVSFRLFSRLVFAVDVAEYALQQENEWQKLVALYILPRVVKNMNEEQRKSLLDKVLSLLDTEYNLLFQAAVNVMQHFCEEQAELATYCMNCLQLEQYPQRQAYVNMMMDGLV